MTRKSDRFSKREALHSRIQTPYLSNEKLSRRGHKIPTKLFERRKIKRLRQQSKPIISFARYLHRMLKEFNYKSFSVRAMNVIDNFCLDMFRKIAELAGHLVKHSHRITLNQSDIFAAIKLLLPMELRNHANSKGIKALRMYKNSIHDKENNRQRVVTFSEFVCVCPVD